MAGQQAPPQLQAPPTLRSTGRFILHSCCCSTAHAHATVSTSAAAARPQKRACVEFKQLFRPRAACCVCPAEKTNNRAHRLSFIRSFVSLFGFFRAGQGQGPARNPEGQGTGARASKGSRLLLSYRFDCDHLLPHHLCQLEPLLPAVDVLATASGQRARIPGVGDQRVTSHHLQPPS